MKKLLLFICFLAIAVIAVYTCIWMFYSRLSNSATKEDFYGDWIGKLDDNGGGDFTLIRK